MDDYAGFLLVGLPMTNRMNMQQYRAHVAQSSVSGSGRVVPVSRPVAPRVAPATGKAAMYALGRLKTGEMNKTEAAYAAHLESLKAAGEIVWFKFEGLKFRLADNTFYTPDFAVMLASGQLQAREVKGHWEDDARAKIKIAAAIIATFKNRWFDTGIAR